ncbi:MAG: hypothetical protein U5P41_14550 [Gammaproteobacteria bacterium]|nr:hypothetical protein [Gammaproteobacteria bacterium]
MLVRVVDATAVSAVLFGEPAADYIVEQLEDAVIIVPTVLESHLCEICLQKMDDGDGYDGRYLEALSLLQVMDLHTIKQDPSEIVRFAAEKNITVSEAYYLRLVYAFDADLVSLNETLIHPETAEILTA